MKFLLLPLMALMLFFCHPDSSGQISRPKVVILGSWQLSSCQFETAPEVNLVNVSVPDFSSQQLSWTVNDLVISNGADICVLNTGSLDLMMGIPEERILDNIEMIRKRLEEAGIRPIFLADINNKSCDGLRLELDNLNNRIKEFCLENKVAFIDPNKTFQDSSVKEEDFFESKEYCTMITDLIIKNL